MTQVADPADIAAVSDLLKEVYPSDEIVTQLQEDCIGYSKIEATSEYHDAVGDRAIGFIKIGRNVGVSSRSLSGGTLGAAGHQKTTRWELDYTAHYVQVKIQGGTIAKMKTARQAAINAIDLEVNGAIDDIKRDRQRQFYGNGDALIVQCGTSTATDEIVLDVESGYDAIVRGFLETDMYIDIGTTADENSVVGEAKIESVTESDSAPTINIDSSITTSSSHYISRAGNRAGTTSYEMNGLQNLIGTSTVMNVNTTTYPQFKSFVKDAAGASLSRPMMQEANRKIRQHGGKLGLILCSLEQEEYYYNELQAQVRFAGDVSLASGDTDSPKFNKVGLTADPDCPREDMYFLDTRHLFRASAGEIAWQNTNTGGDVLAWSQDEDAFVARAAVYENMGTTRRRAHARIKSLAV